MAKRVEYLHILGFTKRDLKKYEKELKVSVPSKAWEKIRVIKNPRNALVKALKGRVRKKYASFLLTFKTNP